MPVYDFENIDNIPHENLQFQISDQLFFLDAFTKNQREINLLCYISEEDGEAERSRFY